MFCWAQHQVFDQTKRPDIQIKANFGKRKHLKQEPSIATESTSLSNDGHTEHTSSSIKTECTSECDIKTEATSSDVDSNSCKKPLKVPRDSKKKRKYTVRATRNKPSVKLDGIIQQRSLRVCRKLGMFIIGAPRLHAGKIASGEF